MHSSHDRNWLGEVNSETPPHGNKKFTMGIRKDWRIIMAFRQFIYLATLMILSSGNICLAEENAEETAQETVEQKEELKIDDLFPEKSVFGTSARSAAFSYDGKHGAFLYRPYKERLVLE